MPLHVISAPGDHRDDFDQVVGQFNEWERQAKPRILTIKHSVTPLSEARESGKYMLTVVIHYEPGGQA
ncbi:MAG: hypothetical protein J5J06_13565 [Phycisphaerae bacterium]|nr:hypothetical protein [Phycisphaerae bacterium]